jgi:hypothetical protein
MLTAHFKLTEKPRGAGDNRLTPPLAQDFNTIGELEQFLAYNRAYIVELNFTGSVSFDYELGAN